MSIYRSHGGRRTLEAAYRDAIDELEVDVEDRQIETRHGPTHVLLAGPADGKPVFVFHGGNATNPMTLAWYTDLADEYRLIAPDTIGQPGHSAQTRVDPQGDGYGEWVEDLLDAAGIQSAPMIGTSYGAGIVLRTGALVPERVDSAALVVPAGFGTGSLVSMLRIGLPAVAYRVFPSEWLLERVLSAIVTQPAPDPVVRDTIAASLRYVTLEREFPGADRQELDRFTSPVTLFAAENDPFFPPDMAVSRARKRLPTLAHVEVLLGEKHVLSPAAQKHVTRSIREFFRE